MDEEMQLVETECERLAKQRTELIASLGQSVCVATELEIALKRKDARN